MPRDGKVIVVGMIGGGGVAVSVEPIPDGHAFVQVNGGALQVRDAHGSTIAVYAPGFWCFCRWMDPSVFSAPPARDESRLVVPRDSLVVP